MQKVAIATILIFWMDFKVKGVEGGPGGSSDQISCQAYMNVLETLKPNAFYRIEKSFFCSRHIIWKFPKYKDFNFKHDFLKIHSNRIRALSIYPIS